MKEKKLLINMLKIKRMIITYKQILLLNQMNHHQNLYEGLLRLTLYIYIIKFIKMYYIF